MKGVLVFDHHNELVYLNWDGDNDEKFQNLLKRFSTNSEEQSNKNVYISQLFSPILISQRIMGAQFANTYKSVQCENNNIIFGDWLDNNIIIAGKVDTEELTRQLLDFKTLLQHLFGQNHVLLTSKSFSIWLDTLVNNFDAGDAIPGVCGVVDSCDATLESLKTLKLCNIWFKHHKYQKYHALIIAGDKLLALYSSKTSFDILPADLLLMTLQSKASHAYWESTNATDTDYFNLPWLTIENSAVINLCIEFNGTIFPAVPHSFHIGHIAKGLSVIFLFDLNLRDLGIHTAICIKYLYLLKSILLQRNTDTSQLLEKIEYHTKKVIEELKAKKDFADLASKIKLRLEDLKRACNKMTTLSPELAVTSLNSVLENVFEILRPPVPHLELADMIMKIQCHLNHHKSLLLAKSSNIFEIEYPLSEPGDYPEFPGLLHYIYIDRTSGRYIAPPMYKYKNMITKQAIQGILQKSLKVLQNGCSYAAWRTDKLHILYAIWLENSTTRLNSNVSSMLRQLPIPGDITGTFYNHYVDLYCPNDRNVLMKEIIILHLGLVPINVCFQNARKLAHDICEESALRTTSWEDLL